MMKRLAIAIAIAMAAYGTLVPKVNAGETCTTVNHTEYCSGDIPFFDLTIPDTDLGGPLLFNNPTSTYVPKVYNEAVPAPLGIPAPEGKRVKAPTAKECEEARSWATRLYLGC